MEWNKNLGLTLLFILFSSAVQCQDRVSGNAFYRGLESITIEFYKTPTWNWKTRCRTWDLAAICTCPMVIHPDEPYTLFSTVEDTDTAQIDRVKIQDIIRLVMKEPYYLTEEWYLEPAHPHPPGKSVYRVQRVARFLFEAFSGYNVADSDDLDYMISRNTATGMRSVSRMNGMEDDTDHSFLNIFLKTPQLDYISFPSNYDFIWKKKQE
jgi:hypothetical protein